MERHACHIPKAGSMKAVPLRNECECIACTTRERGQVQSLHFYAAHLLGCSQGRVGHQHQLLCCLQELCKIASAQTGI